MNGLAEAVLEELRTDGEDEEGDEELRKRYFASFDADAFGGNIPDYRRKVGALENVGGVKVYPVWQGGGSVRLVIIDQGWKKPTAVEVEKLQALIDPEIRGEGYGIAPIGHKVTVAGVQERVCNISMRLSLADGCDKETVLAEIRRLYEDYMEGLRKDWADSEALTVRISHLEARALEANGGPVRMEILHSGRKKFRRWEESRCWNECGEIFDVSAGQHGRIERISDAWRGGRGNSGGGRSG